MLRRRLRVTRGQRPCLLCHRVEREAAAGSGLAEDVADVGLDRALFEIQSMGNLRVGPAPRHLVEYLPLPLAEALINIIPAVRTRSGAQGVDDMRHQRAW